MSVNHSAVNNSASAAPKASRFRSLFAQLGASSDHTIDNTNINMQTTQSVGNLNQLGRDMEAVNLNARTAASTPASRHGKHAFLNFAYANNALQDFETIWQRQMLILLLHPTKTKAM